MKTRNSLVSNSSSSSFMAVMSKDYPPKLEFVLKGSDKTLIFEWDNCFQSKISTKEELDTYLNKNPGAHKPETISEMWEAINDNKQIVFGACSDQWDNPLNNVISAGLVNGGVAKFFYDLGITEIEVLEDCEGY